MLLVYVLFTIHCHYIAKPTLLSYIHSGYPDIDESDLYLSGLPLPTSNGDIVIEYSFVYNDYGETLHLTYYYRNLDLSAASNNMCIFADIGSKKC